MRRFFVGTIAVTIASCGGVGLTSSNGNGGGGGNPGPTVSVTIQENGYAPNVMTIAVGTKVNWTNAGTSAHTVTSDSSGFDSGALAAPRPNMTGGLFQVTFTVRGTYTYHCSFHPATMRGSITVQ